MLCELQTLVRWHPKYSVYELPNNQLILLSETEPYILSGENYFRLNRLLKKAVSYTDLLLECSFNQDKSTLLPGLSKLIKLGIIQRAYSDESSFSIPDLSLKPRRYQCKSTDVELIVYSNLDNHDFFLNWINKFSDLKSLSIVIVDDYLDSRLSDINQQMISDGRRWLLIKPTGVRPLIGPLFSPDSKISPCWHCIKSAIMRNQPARAWLSARMPDREISIPVYFDKKAIDGFWILAEQQIRYFLNWNFASKIISVDNENNGIQFTIHPAKRADNCRHCGDRKLYSQTTLAPVRLNSSFKASADDCGYRVLRPNQTLKNLDIVVSNITGIVGEVIPLHDCPSSSISIYKTTFCKIPNSKDLVSVDDFLQISLGKGVSEEQSKVSALCESIERSAAQYRGDEPWKYCSANNLQHEFCLPQQLAAYSQIQLEEFRRDGNVSHIEEEFTDYTADIAIHWAQSWSITNDKPCFLPLSFCYANTPFNENQYIRWNSNGCSAGNTLEEAILQGFLELVERDAVAIWWYNKVNCAQFDLIQIPDDHLQQFNLTLGHEYEFWVLDVTHDFEIPVMVAVAQHKIDGSLCLGFGCHLDAVIACERALAELCQIIPIRGKGVKKFDFDALKIEKFLQPCNGRRKSKLSDYKNGYSRDIKHDVESCVSRASKLGLDTLVLNYSRPEYPVYTVKVVMPGICHIWPQLGNERLYKVPVQLGWQDSENSESQLNSNPLLI